MAINTKPLQYAISKTKANVGKNAGKMVQIARPTGRQRISFRALASEASENLTFSEQEIMACVNELTKAAKRHVENGDIVEFGDLGTLSPTFKSKAVLVDEREFNATTDISHPRVLFRANRTYFEIERASYERVPLRVKIKGAGSATPGSQGNPEAGSHSSTGTNDVGSL